MCDCYKIGGPWITFDPECPAHGIEAQQRERQQEEKERTLEERIAFLEGRIFELEQSRAEK